MTEIQRRGMSLWVAERPHIWMGLMLLSLHTALAWGDGLWLARALMLTHFGFFLMWQPVWRADRELGLVSTALVIAVGLTLGFATSPWIAALWLGTLVGLIGGYAFGSESRGQRIGALLSLLYLLGMLLGWVVPQLFPDYKASKEIVLLMRYGWMIFPLALLFIPQSRTDTKAHVVDFIYSVMLFLLVTVLVLGSFALKLVTQGDYLWVLAQTLIAVAVVLVLLAWLWQPRAGFAGFGSLLSRYLLSVGLPFEQWITNLAHLAENEPVPAVFLDRAVDEIGRLPWVAGGVWHTLDGSGEFGHRTSHRVEIGAHRLRLELFTHTSVSPSLRVHMSLLVELLEFFYEAKLREQLQRQAAYVQAIHETGARLTHDVKNLLQSLTTLCSAAESSEADQADALQALIKRQLPLITQRLQQTLKKLKAPNAVGREEVAAETWWAQLHTRYETQGIEFNCQEQFDGQMLPGELFDSVADNLLQNAIKKRGAELGIDIAVTFSPDNEGSLWVCDSGAPMPAATAVKLFDAPVASQSGLGIGLYQAARQAEQLGYQLRVSRNEVGQVCFELTVKPREVELAQVELPA